MPLRMPILLIAAFIVLVQSPFALAKPKRTPVSIKDESPLPSTATLSTRVAGLENSIEKLEAEVEVLKSQNRMVIERTSLVFTNQTYLKGGLSLILPRQRTFNMETDTGLGVYGGIGQYFGKNHVVELSLEWDYYPSIALRYRYEFHQQSPLITIGPVIGYKMKLANIPAFDNFLEFPDRTKNSFFFVGGMLGIPMTKSLIVMELIFVTNGQSSIHANGAVHFFL